MPKKRDRLTIIQDVLTAIQKNGGKIIPTRLLYRSNMAFDRLTKLINELEKKGLIRTVNLKNGKKEYHLTEKGYDYIFDIQRMKKINDAFGI